MTIEGKGAGTCPRWLWLWNDIACSAYWMSYRSPVRLEVETRDEVPRSVWIVLHKPIECGAQEAWYLDGIRVSLPDGPEGLDRLSDATFSLHVDGEAILMEKLGTLVKQGYRQVLPEAKPRSEGISCLFQVKACPSPKKEPSRDEPSVGYMFANGSLITAKLDEFKGPAPSGATVRVELALGLYRMEVP